MDETQMNPGGAPATPPQQGQGGKTSLGMEENIEGALTYILGFVTGIIFLLAEKDNKFVRFHAFQSIGVSVVLIVLSVLVNWIPFLRILGSWLLPLLEFILFIFLLYKAYNHEMYKLPVVGNFAEKQVNK